ncbi:thymidine kinase [Fuerstiella marisgermanici]|uniref:Thymidine kinase n=1 Tax=Fuerstiella marisgermanici TaxID=1891926 RepID=A0A1P8WEG9_9PLAN|nr:thymidine kinase [Fuerstiella marisgermanici]APZ92466.1 Thymidine kinase [Fuerstiella marisgermanici]
MAKLYFYYSAMNAGKSTTLLQAAYNYKERGLRPLLLTPALDTRAGVGTIGSRIGLQSEAIAFSQTDSLYDICDEQHQQNPVACVFVDEAQFLTKKQVHDLGEIADRLSIPVLSYGLRTDFQGNLFEGSQYLLAWADAITEIKTICHCGRKASMVLRIDSSGKPIRGGEQIKVGGNESYVSVCRQHFKEGLSEKDQPTLPFEG